MKKKTKNKIILILLFLVIILLIFVFRRNLSILPELDNRITYYDKPIDVSPTVAIFEAKEFENDKFFWSQGSSSSVDFTEYVNVYCGGSGSSFFEAKKDFSRLKTFIKVRRYGGGNLFIGGSPLDPIDDGVETVFEIVPDNLNIGVYDIFRNTEFYKRITNLDSMKINGYNRCSGISGASLQIDYIKYVPLETFSIKNDEVWVVETRAGGSYNGIKKSSTNPDGLEWEMIGYHSEIRPATIRDLTAQTEVPAPQIYINLINGLPVNIVPNAVHTFSYKTKWVSGLDSSCQGNLDKVNKKQPDGSWKCESYIKETPIIQQCQTKADCPILPECESQKELISCNNNLCDFSTFSPACKNQLITYQEKVIEIENTKFVPIISGSNSFYCFFDKTKTSCDVGEKTISISPPDYICGFPSDLSTIVSTGTQSDDCWKTSLSFLGNTHEFTNNAINDDIGSNIKAEISMSASIDNVRKLRDSWGIVGKFTLPDNFLDIKPKSSGNKLVLQNSNELISFIITNNLGFGVDGGYTIQTQNLALEGGVVLRDNVIPIFLKSGDNDISYNFETKQLGTIVDIIGTFGKINIDKDYILKSSDNGKQKFLFITKEITIEIPKDIGKVQLLEPEIKFIETEKLIKKIIIQEKEKIPIFVWWIIGILVLISILSLIYRRRKGK